MQMRPLVTFLCLLATSLAIQAKELPRAESCGSCHVYNFDTWQDSAHANSAGSQEFRRCLEDYLEKKQTNNGAYCFECHAPGIVISGNTFTATNNIVKGKGHHDGVTCVMCHSVESVVNGQAVYDPGDIYGYHSVTDLKSVKREALCSTCHDAYTSPVREAIEPGFIESLMATLRGAVSTKSGIQTDHRFAAAVVANENHWACPGISFNDAPIAAPTERRAQ